MNTTLENRLYQAAELIEIAVVEMMKRAPDGAMRFRFDDGSVETVDSEHWRRQMADGTAHNLMMHMLDAKKLTPRGIFGTPIFYELTHANVRRACCFDPADAEAYLTACGIATNDAPEQRVAASPKPEQSGALDDDWEVQARAIAGELDAIDANTGAHDSMTNIAERVALKMRERGISGPRGPVSGPTVLREALQGGKWKRKR